MHRTTRITTVMLMAQFAVAALAAPFTPGNLVISRVGDGSAALSSAATAVFLDEYTPAGVFVQSIALPTSVDGGNHILTSSGSATSEGFIARSSDGKSVVIVGYDAPLGTASVASTASATFNRVVGLVKSDGTVDTTTAFDAYDSNNVRSVTTIDGTAFWTAGTAGSGKLATAGVRYIPFGPGQTSVQLDSVVANTRCVKIINGQLYIGTMTGANRGVNTVGTGVPTTSGQTTTLLPGFDPSTSSPQSTYDFVFTDSTTLYVADDRAQASGGGLQKWTFDGTNWVLQYTLSAGLGGTAGIRGLTYGGNGTFFATGTEASANSLVTVTDTGSGSTFSIIASAPANTRFRGIAFTPEAGVSTETLAPTSEQILLGNPNSGGNLGSWAADDANERKICKFFVPTATSPFIRVNLNYTTTKTAPTAVSMNVKVSSKTGGGQAITLYVQDKTNSTFVVTSVSGAAVSVGTTYPGVPTGTLANYVGAAGAMTGRIEIKAVGLQATAFPCTGFDSANMVVTG